MAVIKGTLGDDYVLRGKRRDDVIDGLDGHDLLPRRRAETSCAAAPATTGSYGEAATIGSRAARATTSRRRGRQGRGELRRRGRTVAVDLRAGAGVGQGSDRLVGIEDVEAKRPRRRARRCNSRRQLPLARGRRRALRGGGGDDLLDGGQRADDHAPRRGPATPGWTGGQGPRHGELRGTRPTRSRSSPARTGRRRGGAGEDRLTGIEVVEGSPVLRRHGRARRRGRGGRGSAGSEPSAAWPATDDLRGGAGNDVLEGGTGDDFLSGDDRAP
jgi:Ca2+-binding RTX toxin-like protein